MIDFYSALGYEPNPPKQPICIAFVGSGGKTTALFHLARQFLGNQCESVIVTTTTRIAEAEGSLADHTIIVSSNQELTQLNFEKNTGVILITGPIKENNKLKGFNLQQIRLLWEIAIKKRIPLLIEADGSRRLPIKAPVETEPVIPEFADTVIVVVGLSGLGKKIDSQTVHRPEVFAGLCGKKIGDEINSDDLLKVLTNKLGGLKGINEGMKRILLLTQLDAAPVVTDACEIAYGSLKYYERVIFSRLDAGYMMVQAVYQPTAGIILAAGSSSRYGKPKQLEVWDGQPVLIHVILKALEARFHPVRVVLGYEVDKIEGLLNRLNSTGKLDIELVENPYWQQGQSSSIRAGLDHIPSNSGGAIFMLADQPLIPVEILKVIQDIRAFNRSWAVIPRYQNFRVNPVLFGSELFSELRQLEGDVGGRKLLQEPLRFPVSWVPWDERGLKFDLDTIDDYHKLIDLDE